MCIVLTCCIKLKNTLPLSFGPSMIDVYTFTAIKVLHSIKYGIYHQHIISTYQHNIYHKYNVPHLFQLAHMP